MTDKRIQLERGACLSGGPLASMVIPRILFFTTDNVWIGDVSFALPQKNVKSRYARGPAILSRGDIEAKLRARSLHQYALVEPEHWRRTHDLSLPNHVNAPRALAAQRRIEYWTDIWKKRVALIQPLLEEYGSDLCKILESGIYRTWPALRARELSIAPARVYDSLNRTLIGGGTHALVPAFQHCGAPGTPRYISRESNDQESNWQQGKFLTTREDRAALQAGYCRFMRPGISVETAYRRTLEQSWSTSIEYLADGDVKVSLQERVPSLRQFRRYGPADNEANVTRRERDENRVGVRARPALRGTVKVPTGPRVGVLSEVDSTPVDAPIGSEAHMSHVLPTAYETKVVDTAFNYIAGIYVGFESVSALTTLLAILNAAEDKEDFCDRFGVRLPSRDHWIPILGNRFLGDRGEPKAREVQFALEDLEASGIYSPSYFPEAKPNIESSHHSQQVHYDHQLPGSSRGKRLPRGGVAPHKQCSQTFWDYMHGLIKHILWVNNEQHFAPQYIEMLRDGVGPTRREQVLWCIDKGYVSSGLTAIDSLRVRVLPRLNASIGIDGIRVFDPTRPDGTALIDLTYFSQELAELGLLERKRRRVQVRIDPATVAHIWLDGRNLVKVPLNTRDPEMRRLCWADVMTLTADRKLAFYVRRNKYLEDEVARTASLAHRTALARKAASATARRDEAKPDAPATRKGITARKQATLNAELNLAAPAPVVLHDKETGKPRILPLGIDLPSDDPFDAVMNTIRSTR